MTHQSTRRVAIIGSGPAGLTAAVYAARADLKPLVIEGIEAGGQLMLTTEVENYPGFVDGIMGPDLMDRLRRQATRFGTEFLTDNVTSVDFSRAPFYIETGDASVLADALIVSTGASARMLGVPGEREFLGRGVSTCATCDGFFFKDKEIVVVGGGDSAMEEATFLTKFASKVTVVHRRAELRASKIMQERALANPKIHFVWNSTIDEIFGDETVKGIRLTDRESNASRQASIDGVFVAIGHIPNTSLFAGQLDIASGYIVTTPGTTATSVPGVFAAGDVTDFRYRQAITLIEVERQRPIRQSRHRREPATSEGVRRLFHPHDRSLRGRRDRGWNDGRSAGSRDRARPRTRRRGHRSRGRTPPLLLVTQDA